MVSRMVLSLAILLTMSWSVRSAVAEAGEPVKINVDIGGGKARVMAGKEDFTTIQWRDMPRPVLYPVYGPSGAHLTRKYPMEDAAEGEAKDHIHHRSLWFTHGNVNGHDFWSESDKAGKIVAEKVSQERSGDGGVTVNLTSKWVTVDGEHILNDKRAMTFYATQDTRTIDFDITLWSNDHDLVFGDTKEGSMAIRTRPELRLKGPVAKGHILNANGDKDGKAWGKRAKWVSYYGPVEGETVGIVMFDHPENVSHPTWWHARDYGLFAANPFGKHDFEGGDPGSGDVKVAKGEKLHLRYRIIFFTGEPTAERMEAMWKVYVPEEVIKE